MHPPRRGSEHDHAALRLSTCELRPTKLLSNTIPQDPLRIGLNINLDPPSKLWVCLFEGAHSEVDKETHSKVTHCRLMKGGAAVVDDKFTIQGFVGEGRSRTINGIRSEGRETTPAQFGPSCLQERGLCVEMGV